MGEVSLMNFPSIVKKAREKLGMSQEEMAHALKISFATINRWENGKTHPNKMAKFVFFAFCKEHDIEAETMLHEKGEGVE
jgi:ribosome-binding protein aMBF1 (putative translation factor)